MPKNFVGEHFCAVFQKISASEKNLLIRGEEGEEYQVFPSKNFVSHCRRTSYKDPSVFHYFRVSENFMLQSVMSRFSVKYFCLTVPKSFVEEPFNAVFRKSSASEKFYG